MSPVSSRLILLALVSAWPAVAAAQVTLVEYTFEDTTAATIGADRSAISWTSGGAENFANGFSGLGRALSVSGFESGEYYQITLDATGYRSLGVDAFRTNGTNAAPLAWALSYSLAGIGGTFTDAGSYTLSSATATDVTTIPGLTLPAGADNNASVVLRLVATTSTRISGSSAANGTVRLDNFSISATAIPEPASGAALAGLLVLIASWWWRRHAANVRP